MTDTITDPTQPAVLTSWRDAMLRMRQLGNRYPNSIITLTVCVEDARAAHWLAPEVNPVEPGRLMHAFLAKVVASERGE